MVAFILFIYIGYVLSLPNWFFVVCGVMLFFKVIQYGMDLYEKGKSSK